MRLGSLMGVCGVVMLGGCAGSESPSLDQPGLELRIEDARPDTRAGAILTFDAVFRNPGASPVTVFRPQDGSFYGMVPPFIDLEVLRLSDLSPVPRLVQGCGNCGGDYTERTMVEVPPGGEVTVRPIEIVCDESR